MSFHFCFKSILYENGDSLVRVVFDILEQVMNYSLAGFIDEKKEDFKIALPDITFIGEIKGITSNVRSEHISQLDVHCQSYIDDLDEEGKSENVKGIVVFDHRVAEGDDVVFAFEISIKRQYDAIIYGSVVSAAEMVFLIRAEQEGCVSFGGACCSFCCAAFFIFFAEIACLVIF